MKYLVGDTVRLNNAEIGNIDNTYTIVATKETKDILLLPDTGFDYLIRDSSDNHIIMVFEEDIYK